MARALSFAMIPVFSYSVFVYCLFIFISEAGDGRLMEFNFYALFICSAASAFANFALAREERRLILVAAVNIVMCAAAEIVCFTIPNSIEGVWNYIIAGILFLIPMIQSLTFSREPVKAGTMLIFVEVSISGTALVYLMQAGAFRFTVLANVLCAISLVVNLAALSSLRVYGSAGKISGDNKGPERGFMLAAATVAITSAAGAAVVFLLPACRNALFAAAGATRDFIVFVFISIGRFVTFLVSMLPYDGETQTEIAPAPVTVAEAAAMEEFVADIPPAIMIATAAAVLVAAASIAGIVIFRLRMLRLAALKPAANVHTERVDSAAPGFSFTVLLKRMLETLAFLRRLALLRDSPEGVFLRMEFLAGRRGLKRAVQETPGEYTLRVMSRVPGEAGGRDLAANFARVACGVDERCFSGRRPAFERMDGAEVRELLRAVRRCGRGP